MKKLLIMFVSILFVFLFSGCNNIKEYDGLSINKLTYETVDYYGGYTMTYIFDFPNNNASKNGYTPGGTEERVFETFATFTDDQEKTFMDYCYSYGLFNLQEHYTTNGIIMDDGGSWKLTIEYVDGTSKISDGDNAEPTKIFDNCTMVFYDLCKEGVVGVVPSNYYNPPQISISYNYKYKDFHFGDNSLSSLARVNYKWNEFESLGNNIYSISNALNQKPKFLEKSKYSVGLYTANYDDDKKFNKCVLKSYDMNEDLSNEKIILSKKWFNEVEIELELNKIYVIELTFKDGDFVQYTFNTKSSNSKILYGEYHFNIYDEGHSVLKINEDGTFVLSPFHYFYSYIKQSGIVVDENIKELNGTYGFETFDEQDYLCLYTNYNEKIVFDYCSKALFMDFNKTTFDVTSYHLNGNDEYYQGRVTFDFHN